MSASLPARAKSLRDRLLALDHLAANVRETGLLANLRSDLAAPAGGLRRALDQRDVLIQSGITSPAPTTLDAARKRAAVLLEKFAADRKAATLTKGVGWANMIRDITTASTDVSGAVAKSWKDFRQEIFTGEEPAVVKGRIAFTPGNSVAFQRYDKLYQAFLAASDRLPPDPATVDRVRALAAELTEAAADFDYDVSPDVKRFLEAVQSGGATLDLLTDVVTTWLKDNGAMASYRIVPRVANGSR